MQLWTKVHYGNFSQPLLQSLHGLPCGTKEGLPAFNSAIFPCSAMLQKFGKVKLSLCFPMVQGQNFGSGTPHTELEWKVLARRLKMSYLPTVHDVNKGRDICHCFPQILIYMPFLLFNNICLLNPLEVKGMVSFPDFSFIAKA